MSKSVPIKIFYLIIKTRFLRLFFLSAFLILVNPVKAAEMEAVDRERQVLRTVVTGNLEGDSGLSAKPLEGDKDAAPLVDDYYIGLLVKPYVVDVESIGLEKGSDSPFGMGNVETVGADESEPYGTLLIGKELIVNGVPVKIDVDNILGGIANADNVEEPYENTNVKEQWLVTARADLEQKIGLGHLFFGGGMAVARISDSVINVDLKKEQSQGGSVRSSGDNSLRVGWVVGLGVEIPLNKENIKNVKGDGDWVLQMEGSYINFKEGASLIGSSGSRCGSSGARIPCLNNIKDGEVTLVRLVLIRRFSW